MLVIAWNVTLALLMLLLMFVLLVVLFDCLLNLVDGLCMVGIAVVCGLRWFCGFVWCGFWMFVVLV